MSFRGVPADSLTPAPIVRETPAPVERRAPARAKEPRGLGRAMKRAWAKLRWTLSTWRYSRRRAAMLSGFVPAAVQAEAQAAAEPVYVVFGAT